MIERILVTGGAGFIGSHTVDLLLKQDKQVVILDNLSSGKLQYLNLQHPNLDFVEGDVLDLTLVRQLIETCDAVLHLAAVSSVPQSMINPIYTLQVNTQGLLHILVAIHELKRPLRLVYASSAAVYGELETLPAHDDQALTAHVLSPYALQKRQAEEYADLFALMHGVMSLGLRYFNVYGVRQDPQSTYAGVISRFVSAYQAGETLTIFGDGQQARDFIHVSDIARANALALASNATGVMNIATGKAQSLLELVQCLETVGGQRANVQFAPARAGDIKLSYAAIRRAQQQLSFSAQVQLQDGLREMMAAVKTI